MKMKMRVVEVRSFMGYSQVLMTPVDPSLPTAGVVSILSIPAIDGDWKKLAEIYPNDSLHDLDITPVPAAPADKAEKPAGKA